MKEVHIKNQIKTFAIKYGIACGVLLAVFIAVFLYSSTLEEDLSRIKSKVLNLNSEISEKNREYNKAEGGLEKFLKISNKKIPTQSGYKESYQRIKAILPQIERLKKIYSFKKLTFTLGAVEKDRDFSKGEFESYNGGLSLYFEGVSDQFVLSFMNDLSNLLPGYLTLNEFFISKKTPINKSSSKSFLTVKNFHFVSGKIGFDWVTIKAKEAKK